MPFVVMVRISPRCERECYDEPEGFIKRVGDRDDSMGSVVGQIQERLPLGQGAGFSFHNDHACCCCCS